ncbi:unnamed protein product [Tilletia caries]|uniref:Uncharacterized protein n=1 Tax=Tilletia caries TaxID=13290 RepID=A0A177U9J2_9BASI|nr:hypothetical protein CF336_g6929 [Tilletia laevis]KAE8256599.1 hypothetical protein A4X03_0g5243 [Tilletia caries]CAD6903378.1 unnamed protein product [Tilletia controversa]KAE8191135.1 hypothetical protein CF335_g6168 [Tilletia laevis]CAD6888950.1 unnamed protein product [Tilletia caries]
METPPLAHSRLDQDICLTITRPVVIEEDEHYGFVRKQPRWPLGVTLLRTNDGKTTSWTTELLLTQDLQDITLPPSTSHDNTDSFLDFSSSVDDPQAQQLLAVLRQFTTGPQPPETVDPGFNISSLMVSLAERSTVQLSVQPQARPSAITILRANVDERPGFVFFSLSDLENAAAAKYNMDTDHVANIARDLSGILLHHVYRADHNLLWDQLVSEMETEVPNARELVDEALKQDERLNCIAIAVDEAMQNAYVAMNYKAERVPATSETYHARFFRRENGSVAVKPAPPKREYRGYGATFEEFSLTSLQDRYNTIKSAFRGSESEFHPITIHFVAAMKIGEEHTPISRQDKRSLMINDPLTREEHQSNRMLNGKAHAEMVLLRHAAANGIQLRAMGVSKPACNHCEPRLAESAITLATGGGRATGKLHIDAWADPDTVTTSVISSIDAETASSFPVKLTDAQLALNGIGNPAGFFGSRNHLAADLDKQLGDVGTLLGNII